MKPLLPVLLLFIRLSSLAADKPLALSTLVSEGWKYNVIEVKAKDFGTNYVVCSVYYLEGIRPPTKTYLKDVVVYDYPDRRLATGGTVDLNTLAVRVGNAQAGSKRLEAYRCVMRR